MASQNAIQRDSRSTFSNIRAVKNISGGPTPAPRTFTASVTGINAAPILVTVKVLEHVNGLVTLSWPAIVSAGNINNTNVNWTGLPLDLKPAADQVFPIIIVNNSAESVGAIFIGANGTGTFLVLPGGSWTTSAVGQVASFCVTYSLV